MSTNASVHVKCGDGQVRSIYIHWDGYLSHTGRLLRDHYNTQELAEELVSMGDCSSLNETLEGCEFYCRDRNEDWSDVKFNESFNLQDSLKHNEQEYDYYFDTKQWHLITGDVFTPLGLVKECEED